MRLARESARRTALIDDSCRATCNRAMGAASRGRATLGHARSSGSSGWRVESGVEAVLELQRAGA
eukprot:1034625-Prymnesium_polylepis.1